MSLVPLAHGEAREAYDVAILKQDESSLARCYVELYRAAQRVCSGDLSGCNDDAATAIEALRSVIS